MEREKRTKGITLISLVVTVIILLILAGIGIGMVTGENGLLRKAIQVREKTNIEDYKEIIELNRGRPEIESGANGIDNKKYMDMYEEELRNEKKLEDASITRVDEGKIRVATKEGYVYYVTKDKIEYIGKQRNGEAPTINSSNTKVKITPSEWTKGKVRVTIETTENTEGFELQYSIDKGKTWTKYPNEGFEIEDNGVAIYARIINNLEEYNGTASATVGNIDRLPPKEFTPKVSAVGPTTLTLEGSTTDAEATNVNGMSGEVKYYFSKDGGTSWEPKDASGKEIGQTSGTYIFKNLTRETKYSNLKMKAEDKAGNVYITTASISGTTTIETYQITYNANGGNGGPQAQTKKYGKSIKISEMTGMKEKYVFCGWATSQTNANNGKIEYKTGDEYNKNESLNLYAVWGKEIILSDDLGELVDYNVDIDGINDNFDWKIFYQGTQKDGDANGRIYLIAADYVPNFIIDKNAKNLQMTAVGGLRRYWTSSSVALQDMSRKSLFMTSKYSLDSTTSYGNTKMLSALLNVNNWENFKDSKGYADCVIGGPTFEMWSAAWNSIIPESGQDENGFVKINYIVESTGYCPTSKTTTNKVMYMNGTVTQPTNYILLSTEKKYKLFFPHTEYLNVKVGDITDTCYGYILTSPSTRESRAYMVVWYTGSLDYGGPGDAFGSFGSDREGLRPVVCLNPNVKLIWNESKNVYMLSK